jgi:hypothetical protein
VYDLEEPKDLHVEEPKEKLHDPRDLHDLEDLHDPLRRREAPYLLD